MMTPKKKWFVKEYLVDMNGRLAAIRAKYSERTANEQASRLLADVDVSDAIATAIARRNVKLDLKAEDVVKELANIAFSNIADYVEINNRGIWVRDLEELPEDAMRCIAEIYDSTQKEDDEGKIHVRVKLHDKIKALDLLGRHMNIFEKHQQAGALKIPEHNLDKEEMARKLIYGDDDSKDK